MSNSLYQQGPSPYSAHEQASTLLPWYVNESLQAEERALVRNHLQVCLSCRRELIELERLRDAIMAADTKVYGCPQSGFAKLSGRLRPRRQPQLSLWARWASLREKWFEWNFPMLRRYALPVLIVSSLAALPGSDWFSQVAGHQYRTLAASSTANVPRNEDIVVAFQRGTGLSTIQALTKESGSGMVAGPDQLGIYTLRVATPETLPSVLKRLRSSSAVILAEPALPLASGPGKTVP